MERLTVSQILQRSSNIGTDHDRRALPRRDGPEEVDGALRLRPPDRDRLPRREPRASCRRTGRARRSATSRSGRASRSRRSSSRRSTRRSRTAASGCSRTSSTTSSGKRAARRSAARSSRAGVDRELRTMLRGVVSDQGTARSPRDPRLHRRRQDGTAQKPGPNGYSRASTSRRSSGWCRRRTRASSSSSASTSRTAQIYGGLVAAPAFEQIASFDLQYLERARRDLRDQLRRSPAGSARGPMMDAGAPRRSARAGGGARAPFGRGARSRLRRARRRARRAVLLRPGHARRRSRLRRGGGRERGDVALVVERPLDLDVPQVVVADARAAMAPAADAFFGEPTRGARGRRRHGHEREDDDDVPPVRDPRRRRAAPRAARDDRGARRRRAARRRSARRPRRSTCSGRSARCSTPATARARWRRRRTRRSCTGSTASASRVLVFTNLSQDHLDFHGDMESLLPGEAAALLRGAAAARGRQRRRRVRAPARGGAPGRDHIRLAATRRRARRDRLKLRGRFNVENALGALRSPRARSAATTTRSGAASSRCAAFPAASSRSTRASRSTSSSTTRTSPTRSRRCCARRASSPTATA